MFKTYFIAQTISIIRKLKIVSEHLMITALLYWNVVYACLYTLVHVHKTTDLTDRLNRNNILTFEFSSKNTTLFGTYHPIDHYK